MPHFGVETAQARMQRVNQRDRQRILEIGLDRSNIGRGRPQPRGQRLGRAVKSVDIVVGKVEPVAHFFPRQSRGAAAFARQRLVDHLQPLLGAAVGLVQRDETIGQQRLLLRGAGKLGRVHWFGEQRIGVGLTQRGQPGLAFARADLAPVERKGTAQPLDQSGGEGAIVMFQLREVGRADSQQLPHRRLVKPPLRAQRLQSLSREYSALGHGETSSASPRLRVNQSDHAETRRIIGTSRVFCKI